MALLQHRLVDDLALGVGRCDVGHLTHRLDDRLVRVRVGVRVTVTVTVRVRVRVRPR